MTRSISQNYYALSPKPVCFLNILLFDNYATGENKYNIIRNPRAPMYLLQRKEREFWIMVNIVHISVFLFWFITKLCFGWLTAENSIKSKFRPLSKQNGVYFVLPKVFQTMRKSIKICLLQKLAKTWIYLTPYVCTERIFDGRQFMHKIFLKKLLQKFAVHIFTLL